MKKYKLFYQTILLIMLLFGFSTLPYGADIKKPYIHDKSNTLTEEEKQTLYQISEEALIIKKDLVIIYSNWDNLPSQPELRQEVVELIKKYDYGKIDGSNALCFFAFINQNRQGEYNVYLTSKFEVEQDYFLYSLFDLQQRAQDILNQTGDLKKACQAIKDLEITYLYPVTSDLDESKLSDRMIKDISFELTEWEVQKNQRIHLLWKANLREDLFEEYLENYFPSITYQLGENGVFVLCDEQTGRVGVRMYGDLADQFNPKQIKKLEQSLNKHRKNLDLEEMVYTLERFLDPAADVPLLKRNMEIEPKMPKTEIKIDYEKGEELWQSMNWKALAFQILAFVGVLILGLIGFIILVIIVERKRQRKNH
ncbi:hypothetical protein EII17_10280 [Clostridiales bacterium COT073_COT-073]|nr:hypothetical protein EII17_10280 [Clostridiales bacterium COT073_COT-073]